MRRLLIISIISLMHIEVLSQGTKSLSLDDCINYALENNEQLMIAELEKKKSNAVVGETRAMGLPQVNVNGALNYNYEIQKVLLDASNFDPSVPEGQEVEFAFGQDYDGNVSVGLNQLIFDGSYFVGLQAARTYRELSAKDQVRTEIDIIESVSKAYYTVLVNRERLDLLEKNYNRIDTLVRDTRIMYQNGFAEKIDVDRLRVTLNNLKVERDKLDRLNDISVKLLKFQMGMPLDEPVTLSDDLSDVDLDVPLIKEDFSYEDRIEFSKVITNQNLARLDLKNNQVQRLPKIYASVNYGYNTATSEASKWFDTDRWLNFGTVGMTVSFPIFDGLRKSYKIQQNRLQIDQLEQQKNILRKNIDIEIENSMVNLESSLESLEVQKENMELAQEIFNITKVKFQEGVGSNLEVIEAETSLKEAQTNYYNALFDAFVAKIDLLKAQGRLHK